MPWQDLKLVLLVLIAALAALAVAHLRLTPQETLQLKI
jgi:hypothetical protein